MQATKRMQIIVGALLLALAIGMLVTLLLLGERPITGGTRLTVRYTRVANLKPGAEVRFFGRRAGIVLGVVQPNDNQLARVELLLQPRYARRVWQNARIYITATSVIGERYVDIAPPAAAHDPAAPVREGQVLRGMDPPDLDAFFNRTYAVVTKVFALAKREGPAVRKLLGALSSLRTKVGALDLRQRLAESGGKLIVAARDIKLLRASLMHATDNGRAITRLRRDAEKLVERYAARLE
ncbi:MAG: MCE family protein, partial [Myxococcales bacterium]|nr:MCE family protein [Myxococcales bacterium]